MKPKQLPKDWKEVELGDIFIFQNKTGIKAGEGLEWGKYKFFTSSDIQSKFLDKFNFKGEHLIFSTGGKAGLHYCNEPFSASNDCFVVKVNNKILTKYIYYYLFGKISLLEEGFRGAGLKHLSSNYLKKIKLIYPENKETQQKIVSILEKAEALKQKREEADKLTKKYLQSVFYEMFGDLNKNNKKFSKVSLSGVCEINPKKSELGNNYSKEVSFMTMADIGEEGQIYHITIKNFNNVKKGFTYFRKNDVLFAKITPCMENGKGAIAKIRTEVGFGSTEFHVLRPIKEKSTSEWIYYLLSLKQIREKAEGNMTGSAGQKRVPSDFFDILQIPHPPIKLQNKFASIVEQVEKMKEKQKHSKEHIDNLFNALMQKAFNGELVR
ncbi:MAG: restriction endonuclease subunit S [Nanoarchaeota archaeon]|nr:restriction endonuclease subunit S [Nanoarchaeota archaeon]